MTVANIPTFSTSVDVVAGVSTYTYSFDAYDVSHVKVQVTAADGTKTILTYGTDYTVEAAASPEVGGTVTVTAALVEGSGVVLYRETEKAQTTSLPNQGPFFAETIERELDRQTMVAQEAGRDVDRGVKLALGSPISGTLGSVSPGQVLTLNAAGDEIVGTDRVTTEVQALVDEAEAARDTAAEHLANANEALEDATEQAEAAARSAVNAEGAAEGLPLGSALSDMPGKLLKVNDAGTGYELVNSFASYYGFKAVAGALQLDNGTENIDATQHATSMFAPSGLTFSINSNGHLVAAA